MRYFSEAWASGDLSDDECNAVVASYKRRLAHTFATDGSVWRFATTVGLNDAYVDRVTFDRGAHVLRLKLLTGDLQVGYWQTDLIYRGVRAIEGEPILKAALKTRPTEIWYDEFMLDQEGPSHGFLLAPSGGSKQSLGEFRILFDQFDFTQEPAIDRTLATFEDVSDWNVA